MQKNKKSKTPIYDFVQAYGSSDISRLHMPGHKGKSFLGCEAYDITEIKGADSLYEADGIIAESEKIASELFGSGATFYSAEGSSQCIRAMLYLAILYHKKEHSVRKETGRPVIVAARNVHKAFVYAAALLDIEVVWLWPEDGMKSLCSCPVTQDTVDRVLKSLKEQRRMPAAVYLTSPDYLGGMADICAIADVCHANHTLLLVDNAHGAYLHFLEKPVHPLDLGADLCCDSAHKTLPVLTGGAYLHMHQQISNKLYRYAKHAMCLFGSTSPSYLIMSSLDLCNKYLADSYREKLTACVQRLSDVRKRLQEHGWKVERTDPLRITIAAPDGITGSELAEKLRVHSIECEYADEEFLVLMLTLENSEEDLERLLSVLGKNHHAYCVQKNLPMAKTVERMSIREAMFSVPETVDVLHAKGRICRTPTVSCPPAIPIAVPGELIEEHALELFLHYGIDTIDVVW